VGGGGRAGPIGDPPLEAEGSFFVAKCQYTLIFSITQSVKEELLMK